MYNKLWKLGFIEFLIVARIVVAQIHHYRFVLFAQGVRRLLTGMELWNRSLAFKDGAMSTRQDSLRQHRRPERTRRSTVFNHDISILGLETTLVINRAGIIFSAWSRSQFCLPFLLLIQLPSYAEAKRKHPLNRRPPRSLQNCDKIVVLCEFTC